MYFLIFTSFIFGGSKLHTHTYIHTYRGTRLWKGSSHLSRYRFLRASRAASNARALAAADIDCVAHDYHTHSHSHTTHTITRSHSHSHTTLTHALTHAQKHAHRHRHTQHTRQVQTSPSITHLKGDTFPSLRDAQGAECSRKRLPSLHLTPKPHQQLRRAPRGRRHRSQLAPKVATRSCAYTHTDTHTDTDIHIYTHTHHSTLMKR